MPKFDRGMIKWMPFDGVISSKYVLNNLIKEKNKVKMPILSEEQKSNMEKKLITAYYSCVAIKISYYLNGNIIRFVSKIKKIDFIYHKIYFDNQIIFFDQIVNID